MKKTHIIGLIMIAVAIGLLVTTAGDASTYVTFEDAYQMSREGDDAKIHVVGQLTTNETGEVTGIEPGQDQLSFSFMMVDDNNNVQQVYYNEPMPPDFLKSEKVVVIGSYHDDLFVADKILLKCPSKYQETEIKSI